MALTVNITGGRSKRRPYELESYIYVNPVYVVGNCWRVTGRLGSRPLQRDLLHIPCPYLIKALPLKSVAHPIALAASAPSAVDFPLRGNRLGRCPKPQQNFDKGFGYIAAVAWYGGIWARQWFQRQSLYQN